MGRRRDMGAFRVMSRSCGWLGWVFSSVSLAALSFFLSLRVPLIVDGLYSTVEMGNGIGQWK